MCEYIDHIREHSMAELEHVVLSMEVGEGVLAEISGEHEGVATAVAEQHLVGRGAGERVVAGGAGDNRSRSRSRAGYGAIAVQILLEGILE